MDLSAKIRGIKYKPLLCKELDVYEINELEEAINQSASFILKINKENNVAVSWWVSAKRTRSYPYARVYDTLCFSGKKITIIPIMKDEGIEGDRDFLQWDTVSLMSLLGVYVVIAYYINAEPSKKFKNKITNQKFDIDYLREKINDILSFQSDALHWNISHIDEAGEIGLKALKAYERISEQLKIKMHSFKSAEERIQKIIKSKNDFMNISRNLAEKAQKREQLTKQPKEFLTGNKATLTIQNYLGGLYYLTVDEIEIKNKNIFLIEGKHSKTNSLPSLEDIKDGLLKMILFTNIDKIVLEGKSYNPIAVLKLTVENHFDQKNLSPSQKERLKILRREAYINNFKLKVS
jgi:hypothetical protein